MREHTVFVIQLIAERFSPFAAVGGPLWAGQVHFNEGTGNLYLTQTQKWLYMGTECKDDGTLSHQEVAEAFSPTTLVRTLLRSMTATIEDFQAHLNRIETKADDLTTLLGSYLSDSTATVVDAIALRQFNT